MICKVGADQALSVEFYPRASDLVVHVCVADEAVISGIGFPGTFSVVLRINVYLTTNWVLLHDSVGRQRFRMVDYQASLAVAPREQSRSSGSKYDFVKV